MVVSRYHYTKSDLKGFHFGIVAKMFVGYIVLAIVVPLDINRGWKILIGLAIIAMISLENRDVLKATITKLLRRQ
jgi:hypothetical protein